ncbi:hypothetical protein [Lactobacillus sp. PSON]|uniref:hypothetical protein n=1 Tax=Lactobacillus sp. PSON TaxID=3455454 RepID=UPI0040426E70
MKELENKMVFFMQDTFNRYGQQAGARYMACMAKLDLEAERSDLLDELNTPYATIKISVKEDGTPTITTQNANVKHYYTFTDDLQIITA